MYKHDGALYARGSRGRVAGCALHVLLARLGPHVSHVATTSLLSVERARQYLY
jgi:hypothetical protein